MTSDWLKTRAEITPQALALAFEGRYWTYEELDRKAEQLAAGLQSRGIMPGDHAGVYLPCQPDTLALIHALARISVVQVPLNRRLTTPELVWQLESATCDWLITDTDFADIHIDQIHLVDLQVPNHPPVKCYFELGNTQAVFYTSGTTGKPKGAMLTFANHQASTLGTTYRLGVNDQDRWLLCMPLYHIGGQSIVLRAAQFGIPVILQDGFEAAETYRLLHEEAVTFVSLVPTMLHRLMPYFREQGIPENLRVVLLGGAAAPADLLIEALNLNIPVALTYGLTEACSQVCTAAPSDVRVKPGTVGKPLHGTTVRIDAPIGEIGEILVQGPTVITGYFQNPEATASTLQDRWLHTGDLGFLDPDGDLFVVNRRSDLIISGGENIYPSEVEAVLIEHPKVKEACVVGLPDSEWGQRVAAALIVDDDFNEEELLELCQKRLAKFKLPRQFLNLKAFPRTASGKVIRSEIRTEFEERLATASE
jgi:O-succinylbenzoic acid--CoA ligase